MKGNNMNTLDELKEQLDILGERKRDFLFSKRDIYELDGEDCETEDDILDAIYSGDVLPEWYDLRDIEYLDSMISGKKLLIRAIELYEKNDLKSLHNANKAFETLVGDLRRIKKEKKEDIKKAQEVIETIDEIINICDEYRK